MRHSLDVDILGSEHAAHLALGLLYHIEIIGDLEIGTGVSYEHVLLIGHLIPVEIDLDCLFASLVACSKEVLVFFPARRIQNIQIQAVSKVDVTVE